MREVNCVKLKKTAEGLERVPYPGELGAKIFASGTNEKKLNAFSIYASL